MAVSALPPPPPGAWARLLRHRVGMASLLTLLLIVLLAIFGPSLFHTNPEGTSRQQNEPPSFSSERAGRSRIPAHLFGTDLNGRDVFSRVLQGAQISLLVGACGALVSFGIGTAYGLVAGYVGGKTDAVMMRAVEILYSIPRLILIIIASFTFDPVLKEHLAQIEGGRYVGYSKILILILALGVIEWLTMARIVRGQVLSLKAQQFTTAARALGQTHLRIIWHHLLPNLLGIVIVYLTLTIPAVILDESFLSFLGLGIQAPQASWGSLLSDGAQSINSIKIYWWLIAFPAAVMSLTLLALNFLGDALRDALDPRTRG